MKKTIFGCLGAAAVAFALQFTPANVEAGVFSRLSNCTPCSEVGPCDDADLGSCDPCEPVCGVKAGKWFVEGHMEAGFFSNAHGSKTLYGEDGFKGRGYQPLSGNSALLANTRLTSAQINQVYLALGREVDGRRGLDVGGRVDFTWGSDAYMVQAGGLEINAKNPTGWGKGDYYSAFAQAYAEIEYKRLNVKAGKFYAPFGTNHYPSTERFFYSMDLNSTFLPHHAGGAYATYKASDRFSVILGWAMPEEIGRTDKNNAIIGGFDFDVTKRLNLRYVFATGSNMAADAPYNAFVQSAIATYKRGKLTSTFDWSLYNHNVHGGGAAAVWGINRETTYQLTKKLAVGSRSGMMRASADILMSEELFAFPEDNVPGVCDLYTVSLGANWTPNKWLLVKPEIRYDWVRKNKANLFNGGENPAQFSGGVAAIIHW
jgi:hypothetical protein